MTTIRAARLHGPKDLRIDEIDRPAVGRNEVLVRVAECGICPSDVRSYLGVGRATRRRYPRLIGHEWAGIVDGVGDEVMHLKPGDRVAGSWRVHCGVCVHCRRGNAQYCQDLQQERVAGGFAEIARVPATNVLKIPDHLSLRAATFCEPLACCYHGSEALRLRPGEDVAVIGAGAIGQLHIQLAKAQGTRVFAVDKVDSRLEVARRLGADEVVDVQSESVAEAVHRFTDGKMADAVVVAASSLGAVESALPLLALGGRLNIFAGIYPPGTFALDPNEIHYRQIALTGTHDYHPGHFTTACKLLADGTVEIDPLISHHLQLRELGEGLEIVAAQSGHKVMIQVDANAGTLDSLAESV